MPEKNPVRGSLEFIQLILCVVIELVEMWTLSLSKHPLFVTRQVESSPPPNVPYSLALFLASPKKKGEKEGRRSAPVCVRETARTGRRGRFFRESLQGWKWELGGLRAP